MATPAASHRPGPAKFLTRSRAIQAGVAIVLLLAVVLFEDVRSQLPNTAEGWVRVIAIYGAWFLIARFLIGRFVKNRAVRSAVVIVPMLAFTAWAVAPAFIDKTVNEEFPVVAAAPAASSASAAVTSSLPDAQGASPPATVARAASGPVKLTTGTFKGIGHDAAGAVSVYELATGEKVVRLEEIDIQNGPDLYVYLVPKPGQEDDGGGVNLGRLKGNKGSQNYMVPPDVDPAKYQTVLIWCRMFAVPFANATLSAA